MSKQNHNDVVRLALARLVVEEITRLPFDKENVTVGPLMINNFSVVFSVKTRTSNGVQSVFVKIPKEDLRERTKLILPISRADRRMAEDEELSLRTLGDQWHSDDLDVSWIRLRCVFPNYNAIVTDAAEGVDAFAIFRQLDLRRRLGSKRDCLRLRRAMNRLGSAFGRFHQMNSQRSVFRMDETLPKLERYCHELGSSVKSRCPSHVVQALNSMAGLEIKAVQVPTLKGIDIRNVLIDEQDKLILLDPGCMKRTCREADLARFIMTYRILYWGSGLFLLGLRPDSQAEETFLNAYYSNSAPATPRLLSLFLIKEQLKHWHTAIDSLRLLSWPMPVKRLVAATYINPYYTRQLAIELKKVI